MAVKMVVRTFALILSFGLLSGCATNSAKTNGNQAVQPKSQALAPRTLAPGECGLFVWTADRDKRFVLFSQAKGAFWWTPTGEEALKINSQSGTRAQNLYPQQNLVTLSGINIVLSLTEREAITEGTRFKAGTLTYADDEGWDRVVPVVGLAVCQPI